jgi:uncharacterized protein (UPF0335 family)
MADGAIASEQLRLLIERVERLEEEKKGIAADIRDVYNEAKSQGFDAKTMRAIVKLRAMDVNDRREAEALLDTYKAALGMLDGTPLGRWALERLEKDDGPEAEQPAEANYDDAVALVLEEQKASTSWLQRKFGIGYNSAARLIERMEREGIVSAPDSAGRRHVLRQPDGSDAPAEPPAPEPTVDDARQMGKEAAAAGAPVTSNPFPARDPRRAAWDEAWCQELGSDGMEIPDALKPKPKPKKGKAEDGGEEGAAE